MSPAWETAGLGCLAPLPAHLAELTQQIQILLLEEFQVHSTTLHNCALDSLYRLWWRESWVGRLPR